LWVVKDPLAFKWLEVLQMGLMERRDKIGIINTTRKREERRKVLLNRFKEFESPEKKRGAYSGAWNHSQNAVLRWMDKPESWKYIME